MGLLDNLTKLSERIICSNTQKERKAIGAAPEAPTPFSIRRSARLAAQRARRALSPKSSKKASAPFTVVEGSSCAQEMSSSPVECMPESGVGMTVPQPQAQPPAEIEATTDSHCGGIVDTEAVRAEVLNVANATHVDRSSVASGSGTESAWTLDDLQVDTIVMTTLDLDKGLLHRSQVDVPAGRPIADLFADEHYEVHGRSAPYAKDFANRHAMSRLPMFKKDRRHRLGPWALTQPEYQPVAPAVLQTFALETLGPIDGRALLNMVLRPEVGNLPQVAGSNSPDQSPGQLQKQLKRAFSVGEAADSNSPLDPGPSGKRSRVSSDHQYAIGTGSANITEQERFEEL